MKTAKAEPHSHDRFDPAFIARFRPLLGFFYDRYFRVQCHGIKSVPKDPVLFVGNHNGLLGFEIFMTLEAWLRHAPAHAPRVLALTHEAVLGNSKMDSWLPRLGAIPANRDSALEAFDKGYSVLVYPGGDRDAFRPYAMRSRVDFGGRQGYARLALEARVPIVPVVDVGGHEQSIVLFRAERLARWLGIEKEYRISGIPITPLGLPFVPWLLPGFTRGAAFKGLLAVSSLLPLPAKMDFFFEEPIRLTEAQRRDLSPEEQVGTLDQLVREALELRLRREYSKRRLPVIGAFRGTRGR